LISGILHAQKSVTFDEAPAARPFCSLPFPVSQSGSIENGSSALRFCPGGFRGCLPPLIPCVSKFIFFATSSFSHSPPLFLLRIKAFSVLAMRSSEGVAASK
jgi:hypothetical protein